MADEQPTETVTARITAHDLARLDRMATRRGVEREHLVSMAIDALLAQEAWSGGFIPPPPASTLPPPLRQGHPFQRRRCFRR
jgi:hypothetical protein